MSMLCLLGLLGVGLHNIFQQIQIEDLRSRTDTLETRQAEICTTVRNEKYFIKIFRDLNIFLLPIIFLIISIFCWIL